MATELDGYARRGEGVGRGDETLVEVLVAFPLPDDQSIIVSCSGDDEVVVCGDGGCAGVDDTVYIVDEGAVSGRPAQDTELGPSLGGEFNDPGTVICRECQERDVRV
jgi:hypothetical protein